MWRLITTWGGDVVETHEFNSEADALAARDVAERDEIENGVCVPSLRFSVEEA